MNLRKLFNTSEAGFNKKVKVDIRQTQFGKTDIEILKTDEDDLPLVVRYDHECFDLKEIIHKSKVPDKGIIFKFEKNNKYFLIEKNDLLWRSVRKITSLTPDRFSS